MIKNLIAKTSRFPRIRALVVIALIIVVFIILLNIFVGGSKAKMVKDTGVPASDIPTTNGQVTQPVTAQQSQEYNALAKRRSSSELRQNVQSGDSVFSSVFSNAKPVNQGQQNDNAAASAPESPSQYLAAHHMTQQQVTGKLSPSTQAQQAFEPSNTEQTQQTPASAQQDQVSNLQSQMQNALSHLSSTWSLPVATSVAGAAPAASNAGVTTQTAAPGQVAIKAGTILFGVVDTAVNSDVPGTPVLATLVSGPFKGAELIGSFQRENDYLVVQFNQMTIDSSNYPISISAYAIDAATGQNAVETSVNHHYLLRYGMLFASGFLEGFGNAYQSYQYTCPPGIQDCTVINSNSGDFNKATATTAAYQGLGQVGENMGEAAANVFNMPPTVKLAQGTGIGVLFMSDVTISNQSNSDSNS